ncbi:glycosyltransferase [Anaerobacillus isosaccharinicus]|uniref:Glycosyltransferase n=1 Tax=Anaerobacillus isosaccharinicus TaxID=1532552 RepID=A0A1S2M7X5_9BACI|nr:glycosyltransferase [Anaerobacillus isosaccharinicus]MBA5587619.1 glycosyltransferase [Anaerobacillus isosaccharinicus]QOY34205.1 glycosyltransferase [Anaerobacillus isosaccharinicus]
MLNSIYRTKKVVTNTSENIEDAMRWADICWFEWCDELVIKASNSRLANERTIICRLHSYEAFTYYINQVNWKNVDKVIFVGKPIKNYVMSQLPIIKEEQTTVIPNGVKTDLYSYRKRENGWKIAYVGYINYKKGPMLLLHAFQALYKKDSRFSLHIAGRYQDKRYVLYFNHILKEMGLEKAVFLDGWQQDVNGYLEDKDFIISTSLFETQHMAIMEAMAKGIKPFVHNYYGAKEIYGEDYVWTTIDDLVEMVLNQSVDSEGYRSYIIDKYNADTQLDKVKELISSLNDVAQVKPAIISQPMITIGILNYNYGEYLEECFDSIIKQDYLNKEIIIVDDCSTDGSIDKIRKLEEKYKFVKGVHHEKNIGLPDYSINECLEQAQGEYLMIVSADDYLPHDQVLINYLSILQSNPSLDYVYGNLSIVDRNGNDAGEGRYKEYTNMEVVRKVFARGGSGVIPMTGLYNLRYYRNNDYNWLIGPKNSMAGDTMNCLLNIKRGWNFAHLNEPSYVHRKHNRNLSYSFKYDVNKRIKSMIRLLEFITLEFDEQTYLPEIDWKTLSNTEAEAAKYFAIGERYMLIAASYLTNGFTKHMQLDQRTESIVPFINKADEYFNKCLQVDLSYKVKIEVLKKSTQL